MKKSKLRLIVSVVLTAAWLCFIWGNSMLSGTESSQVSGWVGQLIQKIMPFFHLDTDTGMLILRKMGHFSEFAVLGWLLSWLMGMLDKPWYLSAICGAAAASIDETIQLFVPGRHGCVTDVLIDCTGVLTGVALLIALHWLWKRKRG